MKKITRPTQQQRPFAPSELILNPDGSVYHLMLKNEHIADKIITVGDQHRVEMVSQYFDSIEFKVQHREFITHTGRYKGERITVISSGIGPDNIDIMINELDAAVNIDPISRLPKEQFRKLEIIRLGTSGALQAHIPVDSFLVSSYAIGLDGTAHFYNLEYEEDEKNMNDAFAKLLPEVLNRPYTAKASEILQKKLMKNSDVFSGITLTAGGFYAPQGRQLILPNAYLLNPIYQNFQYGSAQICNFEMESSMLFALAGALGHEAASILNIIANRYRGEFSKDTAKSMDNLILYVLDCIIQ
jgi:uridine phosphorylase